MYVLLNTITLNLFRVMLIIVQPHSAKPEACSFREISQLCKQAKPSHSLNKVEQAQK